MFWFCLSLVQSLYLKQFQLVINADDHKFFLYCVRTRPEKSWNLRKEFSRPGQPWKMTVVMESDGIPLVGQGILNFLTEG